MASSARFPTSGPGTQGLTTAAPLRYRVDPSFYQAAGRSFSHLLRQRMCEESQAKFREELEAGGAVEEPKTKRGKVERRTARYGGEDPVAVIQACCSKTPAYRDPQLPLKEILYRLLLATGNRPKTAQELYDEVVAWVGFGDGRIITPEVIQRLLERDNYYGFMPVPGEGS